MTADERRQKVAEAIRLLEVSITILKSSQFPESAIWRIADAGGLVAETLPAHITCGDLCGLTRTTGRGNLLVPRT